MRTFLEARARLGANRHIAAMFTATLEEQLVRALLDLLPRGTLVH
ncbi:MAG: hypothetical protein WBC04_09385 [Candidatus Acidiferrales bacterium]